jgi:hypothetical protein
MSANAGAEAQVPVDRRGEDVKPVPVPSPNGNGYKDRNRRLGVVRVAGGLVTIAFYACLFTKTAIEWFIEYADFMSWVVVAIVAGLTVTDGIGKWKNGNGGLKT